MNWFSKAAKSVSDTAKDAGKVVTDTADKVADTATDVANEVADTTVDVANTVADGVTDAANATANFATSLVNDTGKAVEHATSVCVSTTEQYAKEGFDTAEAGWAEGTQAVVDATKEGVEFVEYAATEAYDWLDANACYVGLNMALTAGCVAYFTPKPAPGDPGTVTSGAISASYLGWAVTKGANTAFAMESGKLIANGFWLIPGIKGNVSKKTLTNVCTNAIATCNPYVLSVSLATPAGVGIFIGSVISPIVAQLVCEQVAPKGFKDSIQ